MSIQYQTLVLLKLQNVNGLVGEILKICVSLLFLNH